MFFLDWLRILPPDSDTGLLRATVPTPGELAGNFSPAEINKEGLPHHCVRAIHPHQLTSQAIAAFGGTTIPACTGTPNGACIDPNMLALAKLYPAPNTNPGRHQRQYNYVQSQIFAQNNRQWAVRGDWNVSASTKVFVRYNYQREIQQFPVGLWWRNGDQVPYPSPIQGKKQVGLLREP